MERAMVCSDSIDKSAICEGLPEFLSVLIFAKRRRHYSLEAFFRILIFLICEYQILYAGLDAEIRPVLVPCFYHFMKAFGAREVYYVQRRVSSHGREVYHPVHSLGLAPCGSAERMVFSLAVTFLSKFLSELSDNSVIFAVDGYDYARLLRGSQHPEDLVIVQPVVICHIDLEAGDAFLFPYLLHLGKGLVVQVLKDSVEPVIDNGIAVRQAVVFVHLMPQAAVLRTESHVVNDGSCAPAGRSDRAVVEIIYSPCKSNIQIHVGVYIHSARKHVFARSIDDIRTVCMDIASDFDNLFSVN